jgi:hypothetical protein
VAELVDARDLKSPGATEITHLSDLTRAGNPHEADGDPAVLSNTPPPLPLAGRPSKTWADVFLPTSTTGRHRPDHALHDLPIWGRRFHVRLSSNNGLMTDIAALRICATIRNQAMPAPPRHLALNSFDTRLTASRPSGRSELRMHFEIGQCLS